MTFDQIEVAGAACIATVATLATLATPVIIRILGDIAQIKQAAKDNSFRIDQHDANAGINTQPMPAPTTPQPASIHSA